MKILRIPNIGGLFYEMFVPEESFSSNPPIIVNETLDGNSYFWASIFNKERISNLIEELELNITRDEYDIVQYRSILSNKKSFISKCMKIPHLLCNDSDTPEKFFSVLELSTILCKLYSDFEFYPFHLSVQEGFSLNQMSSKNIYDNCLNKKRNPYLTYIKKYIFPILKEYNPDLIFIQGQMSFYLAAISLLARAHNPNVHICLTRHSSEYFSYNKITDLLIQNNYLFKIVDSLALEYFDYTEEELINAIKNHKSIEKTPNLIYKNKKIIKQTLFATPKQTNEMKILKRMEDSSLSSQKVFDIHFEPYVKCHWNKCTFCGINKKYHHRNIESDSQTIEKKIDTIHNLSEECDYIWFVDEALSPEKLEYLAKKIIELKIDIVWQARCRASKDLLKNDLPQLLAKSGLTELRIGLESASHTILKLMNKFEDSFSLDIVESIISKFNEHGISIHCPMIIGFPQENSYERQKTYEYLNNMSEKYSLFSFNINVLNIDISSTLYKEWGKYQIDYLAYPCSPKHFLGNSVCWIEEKSLIELTDEGNRLMRANLFPWMPSNSLLSPLIFYRLSETSRNILRWKHLKTWKNDNIFSADMFLKSSNALSFSLDKNNKNIVYDWNSHHYLVGNKYILEILHAFDTPTRVSIAIKELIDNNSNVYDSKELVYLINQLFLNGFLTGSYTKHDIVDVNSLINEYNTIYTECNLIYSIEADRLLLEYEKRFDGGHALELGVGLGKNIDFLLKKGYRVTGLDLSNVAIEKLSTKYLNHNCDFIVGDIRDFYLKANKYSLIICSLVLSYLSDESLYILSKRIINSLTSNGYLYIIDLSERDPLYKVKPENTTDHRNFFSCKKINQLFPELEIIELSDVFKKDDKRIGCNNSFGLIKYLGYKK